jgi:uncharacterized protein YggE
MRIGGTMKIAVVVAAAAALGLAACAGDEEQGIEAVGGLAAGELSAAVGAGVQGGLAEGITVTGTGKATLVPDVAEWSFGVQSDADTAAAALTANSQAMEAVLEALRGAGIEKADLRTEQVSVYPRTSDDGRSVVGYSASNTVHAIVRDLERAGVIVDAAVAAGANQVYGPTLRASDTDAQYRAAVEAAFDDARARAEVIAAKAGVPLGAPIAIVEGGGGGEVYAYDRAVAEQAPGAPIEPGTQDVSAILSVTFAIS